MTLEIIPSLTPQKQNGSQELLVSWKCFKLEPFLKGNSTYIEPSKVSPEGFLYGLEKGKLLKFHYFTRHAWHRLTYSSWNPVLCSQVLHGTIKGFDNWKTFKALKSSRSELRKKRPKEKSLRDPSDPCRVKSVLFRSQRMKVKNKTNCTNFLTKKQIPYFTLADYIWEI